MRAAGCVVNDLWDRDIDRKVARTAGRPLASGVMRPRQALVFLAVLLLVGLVVLLQLNLLAQALGVASLLLVGLYPLAKRVTWWPQLDDGLHLRLRRADGLRRRRRADRRGLGCALRARRSCGTSASTRSTRTRTARTTRWSACDSTARLFGERTRPFLAACYAGAVLLLALAGWLAGLGVWFYPALLLPAVLLARQVVGAGHPRSGALPAAVPRQPRGRAGRRRWRSWPGWL